ncbi:helix-hairpin-helix domain-containing protein [Cellulophaga sp. HaHaR_3_176]|uniref:ComEA family DNA-binding protein n=1 Tax=Cellulophaga sp. HaHaR_3_176 TaxID=1942464 RepID=UPI001C1FC761|nr:helix-hairpin-helix domain-containing protein [Cellulophaga sp. HaHaR_3_176]QWX84417.1 helix-hairpin-helix domain-containing protein [Cellulophaga sp. HaHaR_3_176]
MNKFKSHFKFDKQERSGIFFLLGIIIFLQLGYYAYKSYKTDNDSSFVLNQEVEKRVLLLKKNKEKDGKSFFPFNPNYISDYKGYKLGMSVKEIKRLHKYRSQNKFVNSNLEFQVVTRVSDSLLNIISPFFKFPEWKTFKKYNTKQNNTSKAQNKNSLVIKQDINKASSEDFKTIYGIGDKLSLRIVKFRDRLGGFLVEDQLYDVYGLKPEVVEKTLQKFKIITKPNIIKINLNTSSASELSKNLYLNYILSNKIVQYREENNGFSSFEELSKIEGFPSEKINRISLYLAL